MPLSWCSAMWQCAIQRPTLVTSSTMSTISPVRTSTVSLHTRFGSDDAVAGEDEEAPGAVDVERVVHRVVGVHLVDQPDLHAVADAEPPLDGVVLGVVGAVDELPAHVRRRRELVDLDHVVFPLDAVGRRVAVAVPAWACAHGHRGRSACSCSCSACSCSWPCSPWPWWPAVADCTSRAGSSFMPHLRAVVGGLAGRPPDASGTRKPVGAASAMSFIPHSGQRPGLSLDRPRDASGTRRRAPRPRRRRARPCPSPPRTPASCPAARRAAASAARARR